MKKLYFAFFAVLFFSFYESKSQTCQYDMVWLATGEYGVWPDSATNFVSGNVGTPYTQNVTIRVPYDTTVAGLGNVHFSHIDLQTNISSPVNYGLPPGLSLAGTPANFHFPGNDTSCMVIYGTPTTAGTYMLSFQLKTYVTEFPFSSVNTQTLTYYKIVINTPIGLNDATASKFEVSNPIPNPSSSVSLIKYSLPKSGTSKLSLYNTLGKNILSKKAEGKQGENSFELDVNELASGVYLYTLEFEGKSITKRLIVNND
ncbi:MAG: Por secretion system C-terminal sorting protein [Bacteroidetes bacterium]|jgi:hypothetical protein|nr:Por secretion system C-terminal sorting protein [Bacteroidota bacterium]